MSNKRLEDVKKKLFEMNEIISKLDPTIRAAAFDILQPEYFETPAVPPKNDTRKKEAAARPGTHPDDLGKFISAHEQTKPADNVTLLAAWLYSHYGSYPITAKEIKELGDTCGLLTPRRSDNTMRQARHKGKALFIRNGKGWKPTITGEIYFNETYGVKKGNKPLPKEQD